MATLSTLPTGSPAARELLEAGSLWQLTAPLNLYSRAHGAGLATQAAAGRVLQLRDGTRAGAPGEAARLRVRLLEDGYPGWIEPNHLLGHAVSGSRPRSQLLQRPQIEARLPAVLAAAKAAMLQPNTYLWGGSLGPDFDCSGLVQTLFASQGIWLPRDAYLQERFCQPVAVRPGATALLRPGDLIFFGTPRRCTHVGLHLTGGRYLHSSGVAHGRNGIGIDDLSPHNPDPVARHYRLELRGAGRVMHCHDGSACGD
ncbi:C40 family peptidase [Synechococcus sp. CBW1002]|uniref:C40 family peptidase n=1 Tax=Synechococcus sp. CBW1002 TaxID=1353134 RepID=UPI0018CFE31C|nr:C40 family peptidase [Synechococcus sp. CBW1002]QPN61209.1 C40 family peptidase [Synechococcus sp. CBW1002]